MTSLPAQVGPYHIEARLGGGGMGIVYRAVDAAGRTVALKVLRRALDSEEGESLRERLRRGRLGPDEARGFGVQVCRGLEAVHARGIVHRDLSPSHVFLCADGTAKILDFGIALLSTAGTF